MKDLYDDDPPFIDVALTLRNCGCGYLVVLAMYLNTLLMIAIHLRLGPVRREEEMQPILVTATKKEKTARHRVEKKDMEELPFDKYQEVETQDLSPSTRKTLKMMESYPELLPLAKTATETLSPMEMVKQMKKKKKKEEEENAKEREIGREKENEKEDEIEKVKKKTSKEREKDKEKLSKEKPSREHLLKEKRLKDKDSKEKASKERASKERGSKEKGSKEKGSKEKGAKEKGSKERGSKEKGKERGSKERREKDDKISSEDKKGDRTLMSARMSIRLPRAPKGHHEEELEQMEKFLAEEDISAIEK